MKNKKDLVQLIIYGLITLNIFWVSIMPLPKAENCSPFLFYSDVASPYQIQLEIADCKSINFINSSKLIQIPFLILSGGIACLIFFVVVNSIDYMRGS